ncbi:hypothetical protein [Nostocoides sp. HKS02]|uniref:hypothetical protein n=1 Tax=Nostocoides sp. HKS02 TaxID=1813880 RepID=UPI0012B46E27|nr:hypothetical protein [Tetrasphaera sp. HKS02]QGN59048.1 hypothetical protein GKE56_15445 [Tetrasphaera sp. HKS02]
MTFGEEREYIDPQEYVLERLHDDLSEAQVGGDAEGEEEATRLIAAMQKHGATHGLVSADTRQQCEFDGEPYPCAMLKLNARKWRDREDFPLRLF